MHRSLKCWVGLAVCLTMESANADEPAASPEVIRAAIAKAIPLLEKGAAGSADKRQCFTCHNQALPVLALSLAKQRGFEVDEANLQRQVDHTSAHLKRGVKNYLKGKGQGGRVITAGYALWALQAGGYSSDDVTAAVAHYLLSYQSDKDHWRHPGQRPPTSGSDFTTTYVALRGLQSFATEEQQDPLQERFATVRKWLLATEPADTEDRVFRFRSLIAVDADDERITSEVDQLLSEQREDGGWAQAAEMESDAYATATVLSALLDAERLSSSSPQAMKAVHYLVSTQLDDGSWHVVTRAKPFQTYYESGFPHGADQFVSIAASSWATYALLLALPE